MPRSSETSVRIEPHTGSRAELRALFEEAEDSAQQLDVGNLRFYQRLGFRLRSVERDAFSPATGYPDAVVIDGIPLRDRVWLDLDVDGEAEHAAVL